MMQFERLQPILLSLLGVIKSIRNVKIYQNILFSVPLARRPDGLWGHRIPLTFFIFHA